MNERERVIRRWVKAGLALDIRDTRYILSLLDAERERHPPGPPLGLEAHGADREALGAKGQAERAVVEAAKAWAAAGKRWDAVKATGEDGAEWADCERTDEALAAAVDALAKLEVDHA